MFGKFFFFPSISYALELWPSAWRFSPYFTAAMPHFGLFFLHHFQEGVLQVSHFLLFFFPLCKMVPIVASFCMWMFTKHVRVVRCYRDKGQLVATTRNKCQKGVVVTARTDEIGKKNQVPGRKGVGKAKGTQPPGGCCTGRNTHVQHVLISHTHTKKPCNFFVSFSLSLAPGLVCPIIFTH